MKWDHNHNLTVTLKLDPAILAWLNRLLDQAGGMTAAEAAAVTARLKQQAATLEGVAAEPKS